jgi:CRP-like cAMP-binding protein
VTNLLRCLLPRKTEARLARLLPLLVEKFGEGGPDGRRSLVLHLTRRDLAAMVGSTRESITVAVRGNLGMERGRVVVLDPGALAEIRAGSGVR